MASSQARAAAEKPFWRFFISGREFGNMVLAGGLVAMSLRILGDRDKVETATARVEALEKELVQARGLAAEAEAETARIRAAVDAETARVWPSLRRLQSVVRASTPPASTPPSPPADGPPGAMRMI
mmetsp:Transcript_16742/g.54736  ORF Transcript_16742/g.54736 Transcript_16742/m.54736 type:complete len:126 (+) Transcript_16742:104-481(+)